MRRTRINPRTITNTLAHAALGPASLLRYTLTTAARLTITYVKPDGEKSQRVIEPEAVRRSKTGDWYVRAFDQLRNADRSFRLDRITNYQTA
jgi:predicted DNA-binding transcriptional regulator YafY